MLRSNQYFQFFIKLTIGFILLFLVLYRIDLNNVILVLINFRLTDFLLATILYFLAHIINAYKLGFILKGRSIIELIRYTFVSLFYNSILPGQIIGDAVKSYRLIKSKEDTAPVIVSVIMDKLISLLALMVFTCSGYLISRDIFPISFLISSFVLLITIIAVFLLPVFIPGLSKIINNRFIHFINFWMASIANWPDLILCFLTGCVFQVISISVVASLGVALGIELSFVSWVVVVGTLSLVLLLPVTIAGIGVREGGLVVLLSYLNILSDVSIALSFSLLGYTLLGALIGFIADIHLRRV